MELFIICQRYFQTSQIFNDIKSNVSTIQLSNITQWKWGWGKGLETLKYVRVCLQRHRFLKSPFTLWRISSFEKKDDNYWCRVTLKFESDRPDLCLDLDCLAPLTADSWEFAQFYRLKRQEKTNKINWKRSMIIFSILQLKAWNLHFTVFQSSISFSARSCKISHFE